MDDIFASANWNLDYQGRDICWTYTGLNDGVFIDFIANLRWKVEKWEFRFKLSTERFGLGRCVTESGRRLPGKGPRRADAAFLTTFVVHVGNIRRDSVL